MEWLVDLIIISSFIAVIYKMNRRISILEDKVRILKGELEK